MSQVSGHCPHPLPPHCNTLLDSMIISPATSSKLDVSMKEPMVDIDMMEDPALSCAEYTQDIFLYLRETEVMWYNI